MTAELPCTAEQAAPARLGRSRSQHGGSTRGTGRRCWAQQTDGQGQRKVVSPEVEISRAAAASAEWTLAAGPWEQQQVPGSLLCDILQEVTLVDLQLRCSARRCPEASVCSQLPSRRRLHATTRCVAWLGLCGLCVQGATERRVQIALEPSACPFLLCVLTLIRLCLWLHCALCA